MSNHISHYELIKACSQAQATSQLVIYFQVRNVFIPSKQHSGLTNRDLSLINGCNDSLYGICMRVAIFFASLPDRTLIHIGAVITVGLLHKLANET